MKAITVGIADCQVTKDPYAALVTHALGSCIAVVIHDSQAGVGGLLHLCCRNRPSIRSGRRKQPFMFADSGIPQLFHMAYALGAEKRRLTVRLIGGAQVMDPNGIFNIGKRNHLACRKILWKAGVMVHGEVVGGTISRTVRLMVRSGQLLWNTGAGELQELHAGAGKA